MTVKPIHKVKIFISYAKEDNDLKNDLTTHLSLLRQLKRITVWFDHRTLAGGNREQEIKAQLDAADVILLLMSAYYTSSDHCYNVEMPRALSRWSAGKAYVIPIILRPFDFGGLENTQISKLRPLPIGGPVTSWKNRDKACEDVVCSIREVIRTLVQKDVILSKRETHALYPERREKQTSIRSVENVSPVIKVAQKYLGRIRDGDIQASWKVLYPAKKGLRWNSVCYYTHSNKTHWLIRGSPIKAIFIAGLVSLIPLLVAIMAFPVLFLAIFFGFWLVAGLIIIRRSKRVASRSVLVITPDHFFWGNRQTGYVEEAFRYQDFKTFIAVEKQLKAVTRRSHRAKKEKIIDIPLPSLFGSTRNLAQTVVDEHQRFLCSNLGKT